MRRLSPLPSLLTVGNFTCGFASIILCLQSIRMEAVAQFLGTEAARSEDLLYYACLAIFAGMVFDMFDGRVARMTGATSRFGAELDSLADDCSFGVAPAVIVTTLWIQSHPDTKQWYGQVMFCGALYAACAILRLARYNVEAGPAEKNYFTGLPSPGAAGAIVSSVLLAKKGYFDGMLEFLELKVPGAEAASVLESRLLGFYMLVVGVLMVSRLRFVHVTNRYLGGRRHFTTFVGLLFGLLLLAFYPSEMLFLVFNGYVVASLIDNVRRHREYRRQAQEAEGTTAAAVAEARDEDPFDDDREEG